jgi:hypothetical protein
LIEHNAKMKKSSPQLNSKKMRVYRARKLAQKRGISFENALSLIETELQKSSKKTAPQKKKTATKRPGLVEKVKTTRKETGSFAKQKARKRKPKKRCKCSGCSSGKKCTVSRPDSDIWNQGRRLSGSFGTKK